MAIDVSAFVGLAVSCSSFGLSAALAIDKSRQTRIDLFMALHGGFSDIYRRLPVDYAVRPWSEWSTDEQQAGHEYWQHARKEWLCTRGSGSKSLGRLWDRYFAYAIADGHRHPGLRTALENIIVNGGAGAAKLWFPLVRDLNSELARIGLDLVEHPYGDAPRRTVKGLGL